MINIDHGEVEYPVAHIGGHGRLGGDRDRQRRRARPLYATTDRPLAPDHTLGVQMKITRKTLEASRARRWNRPCAAT